MGKFASTVLITALLLAIFLVFSPVQAVTSVSGSISTDTKWTKANSPYQITSWLTVSEGVTLTIEPGVTVDMNGWYMSIMGHLHAQGKSYDQIHFIAKTEGFAPGIYFQQLSSDCIIENAVLDKVGLTVRGSTTKINNNIFRNSQSVAIEVESSATITGNVFEDIPTKGISVTGDYRVTNNAFNRTTGRATAIIASGTAYVADNQINGFYNGISIDGPVTVESNIVSGCTNFGIWSSNYGATIKGNYVSKNYYGISGGGAIESNTIINNQIGINVHYIGTTINNNNIVNNQNGILANVSSKVDATKNYWGTIDSSTISALIIDNKDNPSGGTVNFKPFLTSPSTTAPTDETIKEIAATTGTPESSLSFLMFVEDNIFLVAGIVVAGIVVAWVVVVAVVLLKRRRRKNGSKSIFRFK